MDLRRRAVDALDLVPRLAVPAGSQRAAVLFHECDDNARGYPSGYLHDGGDIEYIVVDLR